MGERPVVVAGGHMIDAADAPEPRFPARAEPRVAAAVAAWFDHWDIGPGSTVVTQGARGADLLVAEAALARGAGVEVLLAAPPGAFVATSVELPGTDWAERFHRVLARSTVRVQPDELGPVPKGVNRYARNNTWALDRAGAVAAAHRADPRVLAVLAGGPGRRPSSRPGGTDDFVAQAAARHLPVTRVDPTRAFRSDRATSRDREDGADGPKRMLALDGGGMRGVITLQILRRMEHLLANGDPGYRLASTFDYLAGTSTGSIIAAALARGDRVADVDAMYRSLGPKIFRKRWLPGRFRSIYKSTRITAQLQDHFGRGTTLGDPGLRSLLLVVTHRADTDSLWPLTNVSTARYNDRSRPDCNLTIPLWQVVRGSTAAPVFFPPEPIRVGPLDGVFQDGGVTPFNNPALLLFEMATSARYTLGWPTGPDRLLLVSVGTGSAPAVDRRLDARGVDLVFQARTLIRTIMNGSSVENDRLCRVLGHTRFGPRIDNEFDAEAVAHVQPSAPLFTYVRYNAPISARALAELAGPPVDARRVARLDAARPADIADLVRIGEHAAGQVRLAHFAGFLP